ncbi:hypothetical protein I030019A5_16220 [Bifidobacterium bifidum]
MAPDVDNDRDGFQRSNMRPAGARPHRDMQRGRVEIAVGGHRHALQFQSGGHAEEQLAVGLPYRGGAALQSLPPNLFQ